MFPSRDELGVGVGALSKSWRVRAFTVLAVGAVFAVAGLVLGYPLGGLLVGIILGVGCVVMGEASTDTGAYKYPEKYF